MSWWQWDIVYHNDFDGPVWPMETNSTLGRIVHGPDPASGVLAGHIGFKNVQLWFAQGASLHPTIINVPPPTDVGRNAEASFEPVAAHSSDGTTTGVFCVETCVVTPPKHADWAPNYFNGVLISELAYMTGGTPNQETRDPTAIQWGIEMYHEMEWIWGPSLHGYRRGVGGFIGGRLDWVALGRVVPSWIRLVWNTTALPAPLDALGLAGIMLPASSYTKIISLDGVNWFIPWLPNSNSLPAFFLLPDCFGICSCWRAMEAVYHQYEYLRLWQYVEHAALVPPKEEEEVENHTYIDFPVRFNVAGSIVLTTREKAVWDSIKNTIFVRLNGIPLVPLGVGIDDLVFDPRDQSLKDWLSHKIIQGLYLGVNDVIPVDNIQFDESTENTLKVVVPYRDRVTNKEQYAIMPVEQFKTDK